MFLLIFCHTLIINSVYAAQDCESITQENLPTILTCLSNVLNNKGLSKMVVEYLTYCPTQTEKLFEAMYIQDLKEVSLALQQGANPNEIVKGETALHLAVQANNLEMVKMLVSNGAKINKMNTNGETPLHNAVKKNYLSIVKFLVYHGADTNIKEKNFQGFTPLHYAVLFKGDSQYQNLLLIKLLCEEGGADTSICDNLEANAYMLAQIYCKDKHQIIQYLEFFMFEEPEPEGICEVS